MAIRRKTTTTTTLEEYADSGASSPQTTDNAPANNTDITSDSVRRIETGSEALDLIGDNDNPPAKNGTHARSWADFATEQMDNPSAIAIVMYFAAFSIMPKTFTKDGLLYPFVVGSFFNVVLLLILIYKKIYKKWRG